MQYKITTKTPLHIGTGNKYSKAEYIIIGDSLYRISLNKLLATKSNIEKKEFAEDLENPDFNISDYIKNKNIKPSEIKQYSAKLKSRTPRDIVEQIKVNDRSYIPASSIKGAIRTAILYDLFSVNDFAKVDKFLNNRNIKKRNQNLDLYFQKKLTNPNKRNFANYSIMKFIQISDTNPINSMEIYCTKSLEVFDRGPWKWYKRKGRDVEVYLESIPKDTTLTGTFNCGLNEISSIATTKLGISDKKNILDIENIKEYCYQFSRDLIEHEIEFAIDYNINFLEKFYNKLKDENTMQNPLIKLGHGSGFLAMTMGLKIKKQNSKLYEKIRKSMRGRSSKFEFPKTRKIVVDKNNNPISPIGWVKFDVKEKEEG
ncbi:MAG: type III-A CRISPR-associated RAMP protein Csm5 [Methanosarcinales archaeon]